MPRPAVFYGNWNWANRTIARCGAPIDHQVQTQPQQLLFLGYPITDCPAIPATSGELRREGCLPARTPVRPGPARAPGGPPTTSNGPSFREGTDHKPFSFKIPT